MSATIRRATPGDADRLRAIAEAAKSSWGYDAAKVGAWAASMDVTGVGRIPKEIYVAEDDGLQAGWMSVAPGDIDGVWLLDDLWVDPRSMRRGIGSKLLRHAVELVRERGGTWLEWEAEPNALGFYERHGARYVPRQRAERVGADPAGARGGRARGERRRCALTSAEPR